MLQTSERGFAAVPHWGLFPQSPPQLVYSVHGHSTSEHAAAHGFSFCIVN